MMPEEVPEYESHDAAVQATSEDALTSKRSAVTLGYYRDDFLSIFSKKQMRRPPLINRGYWSRVAAVREMVLRFLSAEGDGQGGDRRQVLSLGAGMDTTFFQLQSEGIPIPRWVEVDFPEVTVKKAGTIARQEKLKRLLTQDPAALTIKGSGFVRGPNYLLMPADLRDTAALHTALSQQEFDFSAPTLVISECVLVYMSSLHSDALLTWLTASLPLLALVSYDIIRPNDPFGQTMLRNLESRGCTLLGVSAYPEPQDHEQRLLRVGFERSAVLDMNGVYSSFLDREQVKRIERLELFDELEEWRLIQSHYAIMLGTKGHLHSPPIAAVSFAPATATSSSSKPTASVSAPSISPAPSSSSTPSSSTPSSSSAPASLTSAS